MDLRSCLEEVVVHQLSGTARSTWDEKDLEGKIKRLEQLHLAPANVVDDMHLLRKIGNKAAHAEDEVEHRKVDSAIKAFVRMLRYFYEE